MNSAEESALRYRSQLGSAVTRGRRARDEAHERSERFRSHTKELADQARRGERSDNQSPTRTEQRESAAEFRVRAGLPVEEFPEPVSNREFDGNAEETSGVTTPKSQQQTPSDGSDEDFSQARILR